MFVVCVLATLAVLAGGAIGISRSVAARMLGPIRGAGLGSAAFAVFAQLLPEAAHEIGFVALLPFGGALFASTAIERMVHKSHDHGAAESAPSRPALDLGFVALGVHQLIEGVALGAVSNGHDGDHDHFGTSKFGVLFAIAAHTVPIVAMLTLALRRSIGFPRTLVRLGLLVVVTVAGILCSRIPAAASVIAAQHGWLHAVVAGLLLHAALHAIAPASDSEQEIGRVRDVFKSVPEALGFVAGAALVVAGVYTAGMQEALTSWSTWAVLACAMLTALVLNRLMPHGAHHHGAPSETRQS